MEWYDNYCIGIKSIDEQHEQLFSMVTTLQQSLTSKELTKEIVNTLIFLVKYTKEHFADEEEFMKSLDFPEYDLHKEKHSKLLQEVTEILTSVKKGKAIDPYKLVDFLIDWLMNHIKHEDKKIGQFFLGRSEG